jgi:hypothetical protein
VQQAVVAGAGILAAGKIARAWSAPELIAFFPALAAAIGGTYEHGNVLLIVLPAGFVIARVIGRNWVYAVLCGALMPWLALAEAVPATLMGCSLFTVAVVRGVRWPVALLGPAACALLAAGAVRLEAMPDAVLHLARVDAAAYAERSWSLFVQAKNPRPVVLRAALALKAPTWISLGILFALPFQRPR